MTSEVTQADLEPCPFCGGNAEWKDDPGICGVPFGLVVDHKPDCFLAFPLSEGAQLSAWNTRLTAQSGEGRSGAGEDALYRNKILASMIVELLNMVPTVRSKAGDVIVRRARRAIEGLPDAVAQGEANYQAYRLALRDENKPDGTLASLVTVATMLDEYGIKELPANEQGQVDFMRAIMESAVDEIRAFLANQSAALNARQSGEGEREDSLVIVECSDPNEGWSLSVKFGSGDHARDKMRAFSDRLRAGEV